MVILQVGREIEMNAWGDGLVASFAGATRLVASDRADSSVIAGEDAKAVSGGARIAHPWRRTKAPWMGHPALVKRVSAQRTKMHQGLGSQAGRFLFSTKCSAFAFYPQPHRGWA
jgi:hypothetical protein